ncbi:MAG: hypothetical protein L3J76_02630 [Candidatus Hydrothermae bacterium]|nr:hypothetical protein [Candidatus Hydrothermae bacterium]
MPRKRESILGDARSIIRKKHPIQAWVDEEKEKEIAQEPTRTPRRERTGEQVKKTSLHLTQDAWEMLLDAKKRHYPTMVDVIEEGVHWFEETYGFARASEFLRGKEAKVRKLNVNLHPDTHRLLFQARVDGHVPSVSDAVIAVIRAMARDGKI